MNICLISFNFDGFISQLYCGLEMFDQLIDESMNFFRETSASDLCTVNADRSSCL